MSNMSEMFEHAQRYMREVMAARLMEEGFSSYKGEDIHWYRLIDNKVVQAIYFVTRHATLDSLFEFRYGCHPLFIPPVFQKSPYLFADFGYEQMNDIVPEQVPGSTALGFHTLQLVGLGTSPYRVPDILIQCPRDKNRGQDVLELIFPVLNFTKTPYACYEMHKNRRMQIIENNSTGMMSPYFVDEVLFWNDNDLIPYCQKYLNERMGQFIHWQKIGYRLNRLQQREMDHCMLLDAALREGDRQRFLSLLQKREKETLRLLKKNCSLP